MILQVLFFESSDLQTHTRTLFDRIRLKQGQNFRSFSTSDLFRLESLESFKNVLNESKKLIFWSIIYKFIDL